LAQDHSPSIRTSRTTGVSLVGESGATVSLDCWQIPESERRSSSGPWDVGTNDIWTIRDGQAKPFTRAEAIEFNTAELPNFHAHQLRDIIDSIATNAPRRSPARTAGGS
jgi:hypothetical protein